MPHDWQPMPVAKQPGAKSASLTTRFEAVVRQLGELKKAVDELGNQKPGPDYELTMAALTQVGRLLKQWHEVTQGQGLAA